MTIESGGGKSLREYDANRNEDGPAARSIGDGDFEASAFGILIATAEGEAALGEVLADGDFLLKTAAPNAGQDTGTDSRPVAARDDAVVIGGPRRLAIRRRILGMHFHPDGRGVANLADARDGFAGFEGFKFEFVEIDDFAALTEAAFHEKAGESFFSALRRREFDTPEVGAVIEDMEGVEEAFGFVIDFGHDAGADGLGNAAIERPFEHDFVAGLQFVGQAEDAAVATYEKGVGGALEDEAVGGEPGGFERDAEGDAVTLAHSFSASGGHKSRQKPRYLG